MSQPLDRPAGQPLHSPRSRAHRAWLLADGDPFLAQYFQRVDLKVAATFTPDQRIALKQMFGDRSQGHLVDFRHSLPIGPWRFYLVLLFGRERRSLERLRGEGMISRSTTAVIYLLSALILAVPLLVLFYAIKSAAGIDLINDGGGHGLWEALKDQLRLLFGG